MDYIASNKAAWEEAFDNRDKNWGIDIIDRIKTETYPFFEKEMVYSLKKYNVKDKNIAQFCCNNGRELLSLMKNGAKEGFGFDIAENQINSATEVNKVLGFNCRFIAQNILKIGKEYENRFDLVIITIGALCWFKDLDLFFKVVSKCLKENGVVIINEQHPLANMLGAPGEDNYKENEPKNLVNSYFEKEWIENDGIYYITKKSYQSKSFISYSHSISEIIRAICKNSMCIYNMQEFDYDISSMFEHLNNMGIPLSYILEAKKKSKRKEV
jgi:SAM-dependent methyltransferase